MLIQKKTLNDKNSHTITDSIEKLQNGIVIILLS